MDAKAAGASRQRRSEQVFPIEGVRLTEEALTSGWLARLVLYSPELSPRGLEVVAGFREQGAQIELVSAEVLKAASDTKTPQGLVAAVEQRSLPLPTRLDFLFIPDRISDPGNLGTMLRSAAAAGVQAVLLPPNTVDAFAPKTLRAGMGAQFRIPIHSLEIPALRSVLEGMQVCLAAAEQGNSYTRMDFCIPTAILIGSEAEGVSPELAELASTFTHIPMPGGGESLNAAVATGILLFEVVRQRRPLTR